MLSCVQCWGRVEPGEAETSGAGGPDDTAGPAVASLAPAAATAAATAAAVAAVVAGEASRAAAAVPGEL